MKTLGLCMIVKNEEEVIERCLSSCYDIFDEIVIVDTGSTDGTKEICKRFTNKVYDFKWVNDFSKARNFGIKKCSTDYFMWLDADDVVTLQANKELKQLKQQISNEDIFMLKYEIAFDENDESTFSYYRERIIKNDKKFLFKDPVHEVIEPSGEIVFKDISIQHRKIKPNVPGRNLQIYEILDKKSFTPRQLFYYARELYFNNKIDKAITYFKKFLKCTKAFVENQIDACNILAKCYIAKNQIQKALNCLFYSFTFDLPRAEILCDIGYIYKDMKDYSKAIYYFNLATQCKQNQKALGFVQMECYNYIPYLEMCVCYYNLGNIETAKYCNNIAKSFKPNDKIVLNNEKFFKDLI